MQLVFRTLSIEVNRSILVFLLMADLLLIALHVILGLALPHIPPSFNISVDGSLGEVIGYQKWLAIGCLLAVIWWHTGIPLYLSCAVLFLVAFLDDALQLHEWLGAELAHALSLDGAGKLRGQDFGELGAFAALGLLLAPVMALGAYLSRRSDWLRFGPLGLLFALLVVFGVVADFVHSLFSGIPYGPQIFDLVEDGGEMIVATLMVAHMTAVWHRAAGAAPRASALLRTPGEGAVS